MKSARGSLLLLAALLAAGGALAVALLPFDAQPAAEAEDVAIETPAAQDSAGLPVAARAEQSRREAEASDLEIDLVDSEQQPLVGATLVLFREDRVLGEATTDSNGVARLPSSEGSCAFVVATKGRATMTGEVDLRPGRRSLVVTGTVAVEGVVRIGGAPPDAPLELFWVPEVAPRVPPGLPETVAAALSAWSAWHSAPALLTQADGRFSFRGLRPATPGVIRWTGPYFLQDAKVEADSRCMKLAQPRRDVELRLVGGIEVRFRVVDPSGTLLPQAEVSLERIRSTSKGTKTEPGTVMPSNEGRFTCTLLAAPFDKLAITVAPEVDAPQRRHEFARSQDLVGVWDLGDLATAESRELLVRVQDGEGHSLQGANVDRWPPSRLGWPFSTDGTGRVSIPISAEDSELAVSAFGWVSERFPIPKAEKLVVTMTRSCVLQLDIEKFRGDQGRLELELRAASPLFVADLDGLETQNFEQSEARIQSSSKLEGGRYCRVAFPVKSPLRIAGLVPNQPLHAIVRGGAALLAELDISPLAMGEQRRISLIIDAIPKRLRLRVRNFDGAIPRRVSAQVIGLGTNLYQSDADGEIALPALLGERCTLVLRAWQCAEKWISFSPIPEGTIDVQLDQPRSIEIEVVWTDGSPCLSVARIEGPNGWAKRLDDGRFRLDSLAAGEVVVQVVGDFGPEESETLSQVLDSGLSPARIVVGGRGSISISLRTSSAIQDGDWAFAVAPAGAARDSSRQRCESGDSQLLKQDLRGLSWGSHDVWLEKRSETAPATWQRLGEAVRVELDAEHTSASIDLHMP
ncbi:MAG TPA: hypothetical protein VK843_07235 [Planctomycetota bacterium]|nr:hypothetical protein [Planctomycetota bacterium]